MQYGTIFFFPPLSPKINWSPSNLTDFWVSQSYKTGSFEYGANDVWFLFGQG